MSTFACTECGEEKNCSEFYKTNSKRGHRLNCKTCHHMRTKMHKINNKEKYIAGYIRYGLRRKGIRDSMTEE